MKINENHGFPMIFPCFSPCKQAIAQLYMALKDLDPRRSVRRAAVYKADEGRVTFRLIEEPTLHGQPQVAARQLDARQVLHAAVEALGGGGAGGKELAAGAIAVHILGPKPLILSYFISFSSLKTS